MDSGETVLQQPVSTLPDLVSNFPNSREGPAILEATPPVAFLIKREAAPALAEQELSIRKTFAAVQSEEEADRTGGERGMLDGIGIVENIVDSSIIPAGRSVDTVAVQQNKETVVIEVDTPAPAGTESRSNESTVVVVSNMPQDEGHVGLLIERGKSSDEGIAVEVVLSEAGPAVSEVQLLQLGLGGGGLREVQTSVELAVEAPEIGIVGVSGNVPVNSSQQSGQTGNSGYSVEVECTVVADAHPSINSTAISLVDERGVGRAGAEAEGDKGLNISAIPELEHQVVDEVVISLATAVNVADVVEMNSAAVLRLEEGTSIEDPQLTNNLEGEVADAMVDNIVQFANADASSGMGTLEDVVLPVAVSDSALNAADVSTADVSDLNAPELESLEAVKTFDHDVDISATAGDALNARDSLTTNLTGGSTETTTMAADLNFVQHSKNMKADWLGDTIITQTILAGKEIDSDLLLTAQAVRDASAEDREIVVELDATVNSEVGTEMEDLADLFAVPAARETGNTPNAGDPLTSSEMVISVEQSSIYVQLDASCALIKSENLEAAVLSKAFGGVKPGKEGVIPSGDQSVASLNDEENATLAVGVTESTEEPIVGVSAVHDSSDIAMPDIQDTVAEERSILEETGSISMNTSVLTTNKLTEGKSSAEVDDTEEDLPFGGDPGLTDVQEIGESPTASRPGEREELLNSEQIKVNKRASLHAEDVRMESAAKTEEHVFSFQEMMTNVTEDAGILWEDTVDNSINAVDETTVVEKDDTEMLNVPEEIEESGGEAANITESSLLEDGATIDDLINPEEGLVAAIEETIDITVVSVTTRSLNGGAAAEDVNGHGVLIGVGSSVESSGLTITEIADTTVIVEEFQAEQQLSSWGFSEPLVTPPEEEIIEAIGDLRTTVDDIVDREELPQSTEGLVLEVTEDDGESELTDLQTYVDGLASSETPDTKNQQALSKGLVLDDMEQPEANPNDTVVVEMVASAETGDEAEPLDLQDDHSLLPTATELETETAVGMSVSPLVSTLVSGPENKEPTEVGVEIADENAGQGHKDNISAIAEAERVLPTEEEDGCLASKVSLEAHNVEFPADGNSFLAFESDPVLISMTSYDVDKLSSIDDSVTVIVDEQVSGVENNSNAAEIGASDVLVASSANGLGLGLEAALDSSAIMSESRSLVSAEAAGVVSVELEMDGQSNDLGIESALDVSTGVLDGLPVGEALDRNEKKRGREEEDGVAEDTEKTIKTAKTSNGEISALNDAKADDRKIDAEIGEEVQVDKKRLRDDLETVAADPDISIQTKARKTGMVDDDAVSLSRKADTEEEADDTEEYVEMEDKEEVQVKTVNGAGLDSSAPRYKKRKIALFLGYSGAGYQGMQKNPGAITIEGELEEALFRAGAIAESNYGQPQKLDWRRAARTDKGVSAVGQVVSGCFFIDPPGFIERVNSHLPKQIRVYGYKRATASFNAKKLCDRRKYEYVLPVYAFDPSVHLDRETAQALAAAEKLDSLNETETISAVTKFSGPAGGTEASMIIDSEMKESAVTEEEGAVNGGTDNVTGNPEIEGTVDNQSSSNRTSTITEEATAVTEIAQENIAAGVLVETQEVLVETKEVAVTKTVIDLSPEEKEALDEKVSTALVNGLVETKEVLTERKQVTETVIDLSTEEKKEALEEKVKKSTYKFGDAEFNRLNRILSGFEGHHNFHNFTARTKATDPSANRYIISFGVENTFTIDEIEFVRCSVVGQSFMLHQIRKMIGLAVAIMRGTAPESILATALRRDTKINVPMAPELGLFLEECHYSAYNRRFHATHAEMSLTSFAAEVAEFKKEFIYPHIVSTETRDSTFAMWLHSLNDRHYPDFVAAREGKLVESQDCKSHL